MLPLAQQGYQASQIARIVLRSEDRVVRVFHRFLAAGLDAVPRCPPPGRKRRVTTQEGQKAEHGKGTRSEGRLRFLRLCNGEHAG